MEKGERKKGIQLLLGHRVLIRAIRFVFASNKFNYKLLSFLFVLCMSICVLLECTANEMNCSQTILKSYLMNRIILFQPPGNRVPVRINIITKFFLLYCCKKLSIFSLITIKIVSAKMKERNSLFSYFLFILFS